MSESHASPITPDLWMGGHPPIGVKLPFSTIVLAAMEFQPPDGSFPGSELIHSPMDDDFSGMTSENRERAIQAAMKVVRRLRNRKKVLVTCWQGWNRSGVITALTLVMAYGKTPREAVAMIRGARGPSALGNPHFVRLVEEIGRRAISRTLPPGRARQLRT